MTGEDQKADLCDIRCGWVLQGATKVWQSPEWQRYVETSLPAREAAYRLGQMARAQAAENVQAEAYRARLGFALN